MRLPGELSCEELPCLSRPILGRRPRLVSPDVIDASSGSSDGVEGILTISVGEMPSEARSAVGEIPCWEDDWFDAVVSSEVAFGKTPEGAGCI